MISPADRVPADRVPADRVEARRPGRRRSGALDRLDPPAILLLALVVAWVTVFGILVWQRHARFGSFGFDMGIFDQAVWLVARGKSFITVRGLDVFGHHANVAFYLLAPFSWLGAGPHFLNLLQVGTLALGAVPVYLLGVHRRLGPWVALAPAAAFLLHPSLQFLTWELFHPETMAVTPLLFAYLAAARRRWGWYTALAVLAVAWKEDVALAVFVLGLVVLLRGDRRVGAWTMGLSAGWFLFVNRILLSAVNGEGAFYDEFYGHLGDSPLGILSTAVTDPSRISDHLQQADALSYLWQLASPFGLLPLAAPLVVLIGVPQLVANLLSINSFTREITFHYAALPLAALALASVEGLAWLGRERSVRIALALLLVLAAGVATVRSGPSPIGDRYDEGFWPRHADARLDTRERAIELVPDGAAVSASYHFVPHLTHRERIYEFPNPFRESNWGVRGENTHDPDVVEWLVIDRTITGREDQLLVDAVLRSDDWDVVLDRDDIVVARRD